MKKFFIFGTVAAVLSFAVALGVKAYNTTHNTLFYANLDALANPEDDNGGGGTNPGDGESNKGMQGFWAGMTEYLNPDTGKTVKVPCCFWTDSELDFCSGDCIRFDF